RKLDKTAARLANDGGLFELRLHVLHPRLHLLDLLHHLTEILHGASSFSELRSSPAGPGSRTSTISAPGNLLRIACTSGWTRASRNNVSRLSRACWASGLSPPSRATSTIHRMPVQSSSFRPNSPGSPGGAPDSSASSIWPRETRMGRSCVVC